jgi:zinc/manganese transport system substrate-binding protein
MAALVGGLAACSSSAAGSAGGNGLPTGKPVSHPGRIEVLAAENLWGDIARQIGGAHVDVTSVLSDPNQDPHEYQSTVANAVSVSVADVVIVNGADYDPFMMQLLSAGAKKGHTVVTVSSVVGAHHGDNPHLWYDPTYVEAAAVAIEKALAGKAPDHSADFEAGLAAFRTGEHTVSDVIDTIKRRHAGEKVGYTEPVPGYLVQAAGLKLGTPKAFSLAIENGTDPRPGDSAHFEQAITDRTIHALLLNTQVSDPETDRLASLAKSSHVPIVDVTETLPAHEDFQTWQAGQARALLAALGG